MDYDSFDLCLCGHKYHEHLMSYSQGNLFLKVCHECQVEGWHDTCYNFQLDNLAFIERKAKERRLV
jgi:hypothetical protein